MRLFSLLYAKTLLWSGHPRASWVLSGLSFAEATVFPIPPDVMLAPMVLAQPARWVHYASLATIFSIAGGILGYFLGAWAFDWISPWFLAGSREDAFAEVQRLFQEWGVWVVFVAAFTPIPYKVFTVSAGFLALPLVPFVVASVVGRAARYFLVAGIVCWVGARYEPWLRRYVEPIGWAMVAVLISVFVLREWL